MKIIFALLALSTCVFATSGCAVYADGPYDPNNGSNGYGISSVYTQGVDDQGNMWVDLQGSYDPSGSDVNVVCDGNTMDMEVISESTSDILIALPATSYFHTCEFTVATGGVITTTYSTPLSAMDFTGSAESLDSNPGFVDVKFFGDFYAQPLRSSQISVNATCDGGNTYFAPAIYYQSPTEIDVRISNPGYGYSEHCTFAVRDTFTDSQNNTVIVSSPSMAKTISGM